MISFKENCFKFMQQSHVFIELLFIFYWTNTMRNSNANYTIYLILCFTSVCFVLSNRNFEYWHNFSKYERYGLLLLIALFTYINLIANWNLFSLPSPQLFLSYFRLFMLCIGNIIIFFHIFCTAYHKFSQEKIIDRRIRRKILIFLISFFLIISIDLFYLFFVAYPGILTSDSFTQMAQIVSGSYSNHHPFYHTILIKFFYTLGMNLFHSANAGIATYVVFQIIVMASIFSYVLMTLYEFGASKKYLILTCLTYALVPYHWCYSVTVWKDVLFSGLVTAFIVSLFRFRRTIGNQILNGLLLVITSLGFCLLRSNGIYAFALLLLVLVFRLIRKKEKMVFLLTVSSFLIACILKGPVLQALNVTPPDTIESLSIPAQQIARVIWKGSELTPDQAELLDFIPDISLVAQTYYPNSSDPIKALVRQYHGNSVIEQNKIDFLKLYISLGFRYPSIYLEAWVEQTKGYWNAGYSYWVCYNAIIENDFGIYQTATNGVLRNFTDKCFSVLTNNPYVSLLSSIGLCAWIYIVLFVFNILKKEKSVFRDITQHCHPFIPFDCYSYFL